MPAPKGTKAPSTAWKPGQSGNPGGRPKITADIKELARVHTLDAVKALVEALARPEHAVPAAGMLLAYGYGRPTQNVNIRKIGDWGDLTEEELVALAQQQPEEQGTRH